MWKLLKSFKTEINPSEEQKVKIHKTIGTCRFIYNFYLAHNKELYDNGEKFMSSNRFRVWLNNEYLSEHPEYLWIKEAYSKAVTQSVNNGQTAFTRFFNHESAFPKFKKKGRSDVKMYFVKNNPKDCRCERHRINIPSLGWVRIKEKGYIPTAKDGYVIKSGTVSMKADRYYVSVLVEISDNKIADNSNAGIGIDLGLKDLAIVSNGKTYKNINKSARLKKLEKQLIREQRCLSRKYENLKKGEVTQRANIQKQKLKVQKLHHKIDNIRTDYINKTIAEIVKTKPSYITIEADRDRFVLSKGHTAPGLYSVLAERGYFPKEDLKTLRHLGSYLQGHPDMKHIPGVDMSSGSLGQGISAAAGMALSAKLSNDDYRVYTLLGDGEIEEGQVWEAAMFAGFRKLDNLVVIVDNNGLQIDGDIADVCSPYPIDKKFEAFNFHVINVADGNDMDQLKAAFDEARATKGMPTAIIMKTVKGKGVSYMENAVGWHGKAPNDEQYAQAMEDLEKVGEALCQK